MRNYEIMLVFKPQLDDEAIDAALARYGEILGGLGGEITNINKWGKRRLAYEIDDITEGYYVVLNTTATPAAIEELNRVLKITNETLRYLIVADEQ